MTARLPAALVLTAGLGTRLRPLTSRRAKPALPVAGRPLVARILDGLRARGVTDAVLNLHAHPDSIAAVVGDGSPFGLRVRYSLEPQILGSAGGPRHALPLIDDDPFLIVNGDTLTDVDLAALCAAHARSGARVTMAVIANPAPGHYGGFDADAEGIVRELVTAAAWRARVAAHPEAVAPWHFIGVQVVDRDVFAALPDNQPAESVRGIYRDWLATQPGAVRIFVADTAFDDIGTAADYHRTSLAYARGEASVLVESGAGIAAGARVVDTIVLAGAVVGTGAVLSDCIVCETTQVPNGYHDDGAIVAPAAWIDAAPGGTRAGPLARWPLVRA
jgi:mannose-1-phosphate guanylyltransferase